MENHLGREVFSLELLISDRKYSNEFNSLKNRNKITFSSPRNVSFFRSQYSKNIELIRTKSSIVFNSFQVSFIFSEKFYDEQKENCDYFQQTIHLLSK